MDNNIVYDNVDAYGRRYRKIGNSIDYEPCVVSSFGNIPISQIDAVQEHIKAKERILKEDAHRNTHDRLKRGICPFKSLLNAYDRYCDFGCAFMGNTECCIRLLDTGSVLSTENKQCYLTNAKCSPLCSFYENGCVIIKHLTKGKGYDE